MTRIAFLLLPFVFITGVAAQDRMTSVLNLPAQTAAAPTSDPAGTPIGAQMTARATAVIAAPMAGQVVEFSVADGDTVHRDDVLVRFDCRQPEAVLTRARAELVKRQDLLSTQKALKALNTYSKADFTTAQNDVEVAKAELTLAQTSVDNCTIKAPIDGRVASAPVRNYQFVQAGTPLLELVGDRDLELELIVPSIWLRWLKPNAHARVQVSETQGTYDAHIVRISGRVDAASQTIKIYGRIDGNASALLPGMSGVAHFDGPGH